MKFLLTEQQLMSKLDKILFQNNWFGFIMYILIRIYIPVVSVVQYYSYTFFKKGINFKFCLQKLKCFINSNTQCSHQSEWVHT